MIKLTSKNYFSIENTAISSTKCKDFLKSKEMYYHRYVEGNLPSDDSPSIMMGRILDKIMWQMTAYHFYRTYRKSVRKKDNAEEFEKQKGLADRRVLSPAMYDAIEGMAKKLLRAPFLEFYRDKKNKAFKQIILTQPAEYEGVKFDTCGMLDRFTISGDVGYISDLKTSSYAKMKNPKGWYYHCLNYGYFIQMSVYKWLVEQTYPELKEIKCNHIVIGTSRADLYPIKLYNIPSSLLVEPLKLFFQTAKSITIEEEWLDKLPDWSDMEDLPEDIILNGSLTELSEDDEL